jgi:hypothetical protein
VSARAERLKCPVEFLAARMFEGIECAGVVFGRTGTVVRDLFGEEPVDVAAGVPGDFQLLSDLN